MAKKQLDEKSKKMLLMLKANYEMQMDEREQCLLRGKKDSEERMNVIIKDTLAQISKIDPAFANKCIREYSKDAKNKSLLDAINESDDSGTVFDALELMDVKEEKFEKINEPTKKEDIFGDVEYDNERPSIFDEIEDTDDENIYEIADKVDNSFKEELETANEQLALDDSALNNVDPNAQYDVIPLPSRGECYSVKIEKLPVGYLTAADENLITSPNLYESGSMTNILLKRKILNKDVDVDNLVAGDVDAIMLFLRGTSYGNEFPITATDPKTGRKIEQTIDLASLKYKKFTLKGDENGHFEFTLPRTKAKIKFKFLTKKEERLLQKLNKNENNGIAAAELSEGIEKIKNALKADNGLNDKERNIIIDAEKKLEKWATAFKKNNVAAPYSKTITNMMEMQIVSINGLTDNKKKHDFIMSMPASDSLAFRRYIFDNQPGVDFEVDVQRPESLGGGSFKCFLEWDDSIFWNIS